MTTAEIREAVVLTAVSASNLISGIQDEGERKWLAEVFVEKFVRERELAERNALFVARMVAENQWPGVLT